MNNNLYNEIYTYITSPLDQFELRDFFILKLLILDNFQISLTNIGLYLIIGGLSIIIISFITTNNNKLTGNN
jgi:F-type H+-transporting ATPase subunit a